jgi:hypothetical protein
MAFKKMLDILALGIWLTSSSPTSYSHPLSFYTYHLQQDEDAHQGEL